MVCWLKLIGIFWGLKNDFKQVQFIYVCRLYAVHLGLRWFVRLDAMAYFHPLMGGEPAPAALPPDGGGFQNNEIFPVII